MSNPNPAGSSGAAFWRNLRLVHLGLLAVFLLLPLVEVQCSGHTVLQLKGVHVFTGTTIKEAGSVEHFPPNIPTAGSVVLVAALLVFGGNRRSINLLRAAAAGLSVVWMFVFKGSSDAEMMKKSDGMVALVWCSGFWLLLSNYAAVVASSLWCRARRGSSPLAGVGISISINNNAGAPTAVVAVAPAPVPEGAPPAAPFPPPPPPVAATSEEADIDWGALMRRGRAVLTPKVLLVVGAVLVVSAGAWGIYSYLSGRPSRSDFARALEADGWGKRWETKSVSILERREDGRSIAFSAAVTGVLREDTFKEIDTDEWLRANTQYFPEKSREARTAVGSPQWKKIAAFVKSPPPAQSLAEARALKRAGAAGTRVVFDIEFSARKDPSGWKVDVVGCGVPEADPGGMPRHQFAAGAFDVDNAADVARVNRLVEQESAFAAAFAEGFAAYRADLAARREERTKSFRSMIAPGRLWTGVGMEKEHPVRLFLEFVEPRGGGEGRVAALLREDSGWQEARPFTGTWSLDEESDNFVVQLNTTGESAVRNLSAFMAATSAWGTKFVFDGSVLAAELKNASIRLEPRTPEQAVADRAEVERPLREMLDSMAVGSVFRGIGTTKNRTKSFDLAMRVTKNDRNGAVVVATFYDPERPSVRREARGLIVGNTKLAEGTPLRLQIQDSNRTGNDWGWFGGNDFTPLLWRLEGGALVGESGSYTYELARLSDSEAEAVVRATEQKRSRNLGICRPGSTYPGVLAVDDGTKTYKARLRFTRLERSGSLVECVVSSIAGPGNEIVLNGSLDAEEGVLRLSRKSQRETKQGGDFVNATNSDRGYEFRLQPQQITCEWKNWDNRMMQFDLDPNANYAAAAPSAPDAELRSGPAAPAADLNPAPMSGNLPPYPTANGAYVLLGSRWVPLPRNNAKFAMNLLGQFDTRIGAKMGEYKFNGTDDPPRAVGEIVIFYRGSWSQPEGMDYPVAELAPTVRNPDGTRKVPLYRVGPGYAAFHNDRVGGDVEQLSNTTLVYRTHDLAPGSYAMSTGQDMFEIVVQ